MLGYKYILFDLDGTLSDSAEGIVNSVRYALTSQGLPLPPYDTLRKFVGPPLYESFRDFCGLNEAQTQICVDAFRVYYREKGILENTMYAGIPQVLGALKDAGYTLAVATSKPEEFAISIIRRYGIFDCFAYVAGSTMDEKRIKKADIVAYVMGSLGASPESCLMVGDRLHDVVGARKNGVDCLGVLYGCGDRQELEEAGAKYIAATVPEIAEVILG